MNTLTTANIPSHTCTMFNFLPGCKKKNSLIYCLSQKKAEFSATLHSDVVNFANPCNSLVHWCQTCMDHHKKGKWSWKKTLMVKSDIEIYTHTKKNIRKSQKGKWSWKRKILTVKSDIEIYTHTNKDKYKNLNKETKMWLVYGV